MKPKIVRPKWSKPGKHPHGLLRSWSTNADTEELRTILQTIRRSVVAVFDTRVEEDILDKVLDMKIDDEFTREYRVTVKGKKTVVRLGVLLDDEDAPDVYIQAPPNVIKALEALPFPK